MSEGVIIAIVIGVVIIAAFVFLKGKLKSMSVEAGGVKGGLETHAPPPPPGPAPLGVQVDGIKAGGNAKVVNESGDGVSARNVEAQQDVEVRNAPKR